MKVVVDFDKCQSNALCMAAAPEVFEVRDDGFLYILDESPKESLRKKVETAVRECPTGAIKLDMNFALSCTDHLNQAHLVDRLKLRAKSLACKVGKLSLGQARGFERKNENGLISRVDAANDRLFDIAREL